MIIKNVYNKQPSCGTLTRNVRKEMWIKYFTYEVMFGGVTFKFRQAHEGLKTCNVDVKN
jgi:hypothetical protein